jgi:serine/threonine protein phosphatase PrpC
MWQTAIATASSRPATEDRAAVFGSFAVVADGVGGRAGGGAAADAVVDAVREVTGKPAPHRWDRVKWLTELDRLGWPKLV